MKAADKRNNYWGVVSFAAFVAAICFLCFFGGASLATFEHFPYRLIRNVFLGGKAAFELASRSSDKRLAQAWHPRRHSRRGLIQWNREKSYDGFTLYTSVHAQRAFLLSMDGRCVHEWHIPFDKLWDKTSELKQPPLSKYVYWRKSQLFPNGDLMVIIVEAGMTPWGVGLVRLDKSSNIVWKYLRRVHHDFDIADNGRIFTLIHRFRYKPIPGVENVRAPFLEDLIAVLDSNGRELETYSVYSAIARSPYKPFLTQTLPNDKGDYLHTNGLEILSPDIAPAFPFASPGQLLISMRNNHFIGIVDPETKLFVWGTTGPWRRQHDPDFLPDGTILLFDNLGRMGGIGGRSRVIEFNPIDHRFCWSYEGSEDNPLFSSVRCSQQRLPNGNTLITESDAGRIIEIGPDRQIVWEYINPARKPGDSTLVAATNWATRTSPSNLSREFISTLKNTKIQGGMQ